MSESNNSAWPFGELEDSGGLDVSAIFGDSAGGSDVNPFDTPAAQPQAAAPEPVPAPQPKPQAAPEGQTRKPDDPTSTEPANPIAAAFGQQEEKAAQTAAKSLFEKAPIFAYGSAKDEITDGAMTFEELRIAKAHISADLSRDECSEGRYLHYMDIHSHNSMDAKFSPVDDQDERATRLYAVLGRLDRFFPKLTVRMSCGGTYRELDPALVFEGLGEVFPREWRDNVKIGETPARKESRLRLREVMDSEQFWGGQP